MNNLTKIKIKKYCIEFFWVTIGLIISSACLNIFLLPLDIVSGGSGGVATICKHLFKIDQSITTGIISAIGIIISLMFLGKAKTLSTLYASIAYPIIIWMTEPLTNYITFSTKDMFIVVIFAGVIYGISNGIVYKTGNNLGGLTVVNQVLNKKLNISIATTSTIMNGIIILLGGLLFGATKAMYALIFLYISNMIMDKVLLGISKNKAIYIVSTKADRIADYIINTLGHTSTFFNVKNEGIFNRKNVIMVVIPTSEYYAVTEGVKLIDENAFFVTTDAYEVNGAS